MTGLVRAHLVELDALTARIRPLCKHADKVWRDVLAHLDAWQAAGASRAAALEVAGPAVGGGPATQQEPPAVPVTRGRDGNRPGLGAG